MNVKPKVPEPKKSFEELARELGCDEDEEAFKEKVRKVATKPPRAHDKPSE